MGADISTKMSVTGLSQYKNAMSQAKTSVKTLDAELKRVEAQYKATGDKEQYMAEKTKLLETRMQTQRKIAKEAENALKQMRSNGVDPLNNQYQRMQQQLSAAQTAMLETSAELSKLTQEEQKASAGADQLTASVGGISKKVSLDAVIGGVNKITEGMEKAAAKAVELGKAIWESITDSARWGDDTATQAMILNMDVETYQRYKKVFDTVGELTVQEWQKAKMKVQKAINDPTQDQTQVLDLLGINTHEIMQGKYGAIQGAARDFEDVFWEIGETLRRRVESGEMTQDLADTYANALFGRSFANLNPMFALGKEGFAAALEEQNVVTEESVNKLAELNDQLIKLKGDFDSLKAEVLAGLAPALEGAAKALDSLLGRLLEYLQTEDGQKMLEDLGVAVEGLFEDLGKIDPQAVVAGFVDAFDKVVGSFQWLVQNKSTVEGLLGGIVTAWGAAKLFGGALQVLQLINGIRGLSGAGAVGAAGAAGAASGASWGAAFASAALKAAPWLAGIYILTEGIFEWTHDELGNNTLYDKDGSMTAEGQSVLNQDGSLKREGWEVGERKQRQREALEALWDEYRAGLSGAGNSEAFGAATKAAQELFGGYGEAAIFQSLMQQMHEWGSNGSWKDMADLPDDFFQFDVEPRVDEDAAAQIAEEIGTVTVPVVMVPTTGGGTGRIRTPRGWVTLDGDHANGLPFVPFDGYIASLHRGERVVPAREVNSSRNFSSNLYVESMYMNNGIDAQALAQSIAAANRRSMAGYGS